MKASIASLIIANIFPVFGVIYWNWSLSELLIVYWLENLIIGGFNILKMVFSKEVIFSKLKTIGMFCFIYGLFWTVHGMLLFNSVIPSITDNPNIGSHSINTTIEFSIKSVLGALLLSHLISFYQNFLRWRRDLDFPAFAYMFAPFGRVFLLHILIIASAFLAYVIGASVAVLVVFVVLKIILDVIAHLISNKLYTYARQGHR